MKHVRQWMKKALAYTLVATLMVPMLAGVAPMQTQAEQSSENSVVLDQNTSDFEVKGTTSIGSLLAEEISGSDGGAVSGEGYSIFGIDMVNNVATIEYAVLEDCTLIVSVYDEATGQMAGSGTAEISANYYSAEVTIEAPVMPQYYVIKAYMVDSTNMKPLRSVYENTMYTQDMQELMKATVDDFDPERVLNLDADKATNFLVYGEDTIRIAADAGTNVVTSQGDDAYTVENISDEIKALKAGDIAAIGNDANVTIVKVKTITIEGTKATIVEDDVELEDIFECVKIENKSDSKEAEIDPSTCEEGVTYLGKVEEQPDVLGADGKEGDDKRTFYLDGECNFDKKDGGKISVEGGDKFAINIAKTKNGNGKIEGEVSISLTAKLKFYLTKKRQYIEFEWGYAFAGNIKIEGSWDKTSKELMSATVPTPVAGLTIVIKPKAIFKISGGAEFSIGIYGKNALKYDSESQPRCGFEKVTDLEKLEISASVTLGFGLALEPSVNMIHEKVASIKAEGEALVEGKVSVGKDFVEVHSCAACLTANLGVKLSLNPEITIVDRKVPIDAKLEITPIDLGVCYYSFTYKQFGWGECPYKESGLYHATIKAKDRAGNPLSGVKIKITGTYDNGQPFEMAPCTTDAGGKVNIIIPQGKNIKIVGSKENYKDSSRTLPKWVGTQRIEDLVLYKDEITTESIVLKEGMTLSLGEYSNRYIKKVVLESDNITASNVYAFAGAVIEEIEIKDNVTRIPDELFWRSTINKIEIPQNITKIGTSAFYGATLPENFRIGENVKSIGEWAFAESGLRLDKLVILEGSNIESAFQGVTIGEVELRSDKKLSLSTPFWGAVIEKVTIKENVTSIPANLFRETSIHEIELPNNVTEICEGAFYGTKLPEDFRIGEGIKTIGYWAFNESGMKLDKVVVDEGTSINFAFSGVTIKELELKSDKDLSLQSPFSWATIEKVIISENVSTIPYNLFKESTICEIQIPDNVTEICGSAFYGAKLSEDFQIGKGVKTIGGQAFYKLQSELEKVIIDEECSILGGFQDITIKELVLNSDKDIVLQSPFSGTTIKKVTISKNVSSIPSYLFYHSTVLELDIPENVKSIEAYAFAGCSIELERLVIDEGISIKSNAFSNTTIKIIELSSDNEVYTECAFTGAVIEKVVISECVSSIPKYMFYLSTINEIEIPENITTIEMYAFYYTILPKGMKLGNKIKNIGEYAFAGSGISPMKIVIEEDSNIMSNAFSGVTLKEVRLESDKVIVKSVPFSDAIIEKVIILENVNNIPTNMFYGSTIHEIEIPDNVKNIGAYAFFGAKLPENFCVQDSVIVGKNAFTNSTYNYIPPTTSNGAAEDEVTVPELPEELEIPPMQPEEGLPIEQEATEPEIPVLYEEPTPVYEALPTVTKRTAKLTGLRPNDTYNFYSVKANYEFMSMEEIMAPDNILYVTQFRTDANGTATITYLPREEYDTPVEFAKCMSRYDISKAWVKQDHIVYDGTQKEILPTVVYKGTQLAEYEDYDVVGDFRVTDKGSYLVYIVGKNDYCGSIKVDFLVYDENANPFADVKEKGWEYPFAKEIYYKRLMTGKGKDENGLIVFDPVNYVTRAEFVQTLYNKEGKVDVEYEPVFADVPEGKWYTNAIIWAEQNDIVKGKNGIFDVNGKITREEMATILYKYATNYKGYETAGRAEFTGYSDAATISTWATENMKWALHYGVMKGKNEILAPKDKATRAECATMLSNFMKTYE